LQCPRHNRHDLEPLASAWPRRFALRLRNSPRP
jgi:hypothetical protein